MRELITVEGLEKSFSSPAGPIRVLRGIDAVFNEGEMVSIVGASGAGKSTFLHILGTLDKPTAGNIRYHLQDSGGGVDPFGLTNTDLAAFRNRAVGFVFQFHYLLSEFTALENVMMPGLISRRLQSAAKERQELRGRAEKLLEELGLSARKHHKPGELSGGEQQRVAVARALFREPKVVLADEPTGNLDVSTGEEMFRLLLDVNVTRRVTFIIVTHNESLSRRCERTLEMVDGRLKVR